MNDRQKILGRGLGAWLSRRSLLHLGIIAPLAPLVRGRASDLEPPAVSTIRFDRADISDGEALARHLEPHREFLQSATLIAIEGVLDASSDEIRIVMSAVARIAGSGGSVHYVARRYCDQITVRVLRS